MTLDQAKKTIMPFGKCRGWTLEKVADDDPLYLDWICGIELRGDVAEAVPLVAKAYARDIEEALENRGER